MRYASAVFDDVGVVGRAWCFISTFPFSSISILYTLFLFSVAAADDYDDENACDGNDNGTNLDTFFRCQRLRKNVNFILFLVCQQGEDNL